MNGDNEFAPRNVAGMTFYGNVQAKDKFDPNLVLKFRAPLGKDSHTVFYPATGVDMNTPKNSGRYKYKKIGAGFAELFYVAEKGLKQKTLFKFMLSFTRKNVGTFSAKVYHFKTNDFDVNTPVTRLIQVKSQKGSFYFSSLR